MKYHYEHKWTCKEPVQFGLWATSSICGTIVVLMSLLGAADINTILFVAMVINMIFGGANAIRHCPQLKRVRVYDDEPAPGAAPSTTDIKDQLKSNLLED